MGSGYIVQEILGCVVNKVDFNRKSGSAGYYTYYKSYSSYGSDKEGNARLPNSSWAMRRRIVCLIGLDVNPGGFDRESKSVNVRE